MGSNRDGHRQWSETNSTPSVPIHVLVVDDDATTLAIVAAFLKLWRYEVMTVNNPHDALEILRNKRGFFDLVVTDLHMPNMNGFELQQRIAHEFNLPVIMMSADDKKSVISKCLKDGAAFYLVKPIKPNDVKNLWQYAVTARKRNSSTVLAPVEGIKSVAGGTSSSSSACAEVAFSYQQKKRKADEDEDEGFGCSHLEVTSAVRKKQKVFWTSELHGRFVTAVKHIGLDKAVPKKILDVMSVPGLTRENVASHLQKYRLFLKKATQKDYIDHSADRILRSSFATGISPDVLQNIRTAHAPHSGEQQIGSPFSPGNILGGDMGSSVLNMINPSVAPSHLPNQLQASSSAASLPQLLFGQSSNAAHALAHQQNQFAPAETNLRQRSGQSNDWNNQANLFLSGYKPALLTPGTYSVNTARLKDSERHGLKNNCYDVLADPNLLQTWPQHTQAYPSLLAAKNTMLNFPQQAQANPGLLSDTNTMQSNFPPPSEDNLGIKNYNGMHENSANLSYAQNNPNLGSVASANQGLNANSYLSSYNSSGQNGNVLPNGSSLMNEAENGGNFAAPMRNDTPAGMFQGGFSSAGATQFSPAVPNPPESTSRLPSQAPQIQCGGENAGGVLNEVASNPMADGGTILNNAEEEDVDVDEMLNRFFMVENDDILIDHQPQGEDILNPKETGMPDAAANLNSNQQQGDDGVPRKNAVENAVFPILQQQGDDGVLPGKNEVENAASESNSSALLDQDWDAILLDDLLGTPPNHSEWSACFNAT